MRIYMSTQRYMDVILSTLSDRLSATRAFNDKVFDLPADSDAVKIANRLLLINERSKATTHNKKKIYAQVEQT
jgi:hypothetical protein